MKNRTLFLKPAPPFRLDLTVWTLRRRPENRVDRWDGQTYRRVLDFSSGPAEIAVVQTGTPEKPRLEVAIAAGGSAPREKREVTAIIKRLLGTGADLSGFYQAAGTHAALNKLAVRFRGMKPPRFPSVFEALANGIACQQLSLAAGIQILNRLCRAFGSSVGGSESEAFGFARPQLIAAAQPEQLREIGFNRQKARALIELSRAVAEGSLKLDEIDRLEDSEAIEKLIELRGVGRWTAEYALLRGFGRIQIFPGDDVGARNALERWLKLRNLSDYNAVRRVLRRWSPYAGLVYFHMLLAGLDQAGHLNLP